MGNWRRGNEQVIEQEAIDHGETGNGRLVASDRWLIFEILQEQLAPNSSSSEGVIEQLGTRRVCVLQIVCLHL